MSKTRIENGIVVGTASNKYHTKNPIARYATNQLLDSVVGMVKAGDPSTILEVGCGEGSITERLLKETRAAIHATDLSEALVQETRVRLGDSSRVTYDQLDIYQLDPKQHARETVVCCEVLEHLEHPDLGLRAIARSTKDYAVLSVPREPNFRVLNFLRGQHFTDLGNAPGHVQHWSSTAFVRFVEQEFEILELRALLPWTVIRARPRRKA